MPKFHDYTALNQQIHAPKDLKKRVLKAAGGSTAAPLEYAPRKPGRYSRGFGLLPKVAVIALLVLCIPITAFAAARYFGLMDYLTELGFKNTQEIQELVETFPSEAATIPPELETGALQIPEFRVTEAICDSKSLYVVVEIKPMDDRYLLVPSEIGINEDVGNMQIPDVFGMTVEEYAASQGKEILLAGTALSNDNEYGVSAGLMSKCTADGTVYQYWTGSNPSEETEFPLTVTCVYKTPEMDVAEQFEFDVQITNRSQGGTVTTFTRFEETGLDITIHSITIEETELGMYMTAVYSTPDGEGYGFDLRSSDGGYFPNLPSDGAPMYEDNGDGTYSSRWAYQKLDSLDGLQFAVRRASDFESFGPFKILG